MLNCACSNSCSCYYSMLRIAVPDSLQKHAMATYATDSSPRCCLYGGFFLAHVRQSSVRASPRVGVACAFVVEETATALSITTPVCECSIANSDEHGRAHPSTHQTEMSQINAASIAWYNGTHLAQEPFRSAISTFWKDFYHCFKDGPTYAGWPLRLARLPEPTIDHLTTINGFVNRWQVCIRCTLSQSSVSFETWA